MKKFQLLACAFAATLFTLSFNACSDDPDMPEIPFRRSLQLLILIYGLQ